MPAWVICGIAEPSGSRSATSWSRASGGWIHSRARWPRPSSSDPS